MRIIVTGGAGFIGSNFIRLLLANNGYCTSSKVVNIDKLTYAGNLDNLADINHDDRYHFIKGDICNIDDIEKAFNVLGKKVDAIIHFAAESHVDRSIDNPFEFVHTNVIGTQTLLEAARRWHVGRFMHVSTDEVYGSLGPTGLFSETTPIAPNSPYSASKASSDLLARAYGETYKLPVIITRCSNNYGPYQFPEKLIPLMISNAIKDEPLPVYGNGKNVRDWIHVTDHCRGILAALTRGRDAEVYNFGGNSEKTNIDVVMGILQILGKPNSLINYIQDRPGHDKRYAMDITKAVSELEWRPVRNFNEGLSETVEWYQSNQQWIDRIRSGEYKNYYKRLYENRDSWMNEVEKTI